MRSCRIFLYSRHGGINHRCDVAGISMITLEGFLIGQHYLAYSDACGRKLMSRYFPHGGEAKTGMLRIYDFTTLKELSRLTTKETGARYFFASHCENTQTTLKFDLPETARENAETVIQS